MIRVIKNEYRYKNQNFSQGKNELALNLSDLKVENYLYKFTLSNVKGEF